jgi:hypothetical protein
MGIQKIERLRGIRKYGIGCAHNPHEAPTWWFSYDVMNPKRHCHGNGNPYQITCPADGMMAHKLCDIALHSIMNPDNIEEDVLRKGGGKMVLTTPVIAPSMWVPGKNRRAFSHAGDQNRESERDGRFCM